MQTAIPYIMAQDRSSDATHARPLARARAPSHKLSELHPDADQKCPCAGDFR